MKIATLGIDLAKRVFQIHGLDERGKIVLRKRLSRNKLLEFLNTLSPCLIGMESCGGAHYWARKIRDLGHDVKLISPQFVKPFVKSNKNDYNDAEAICEAIVRPSMRFVSIKSVEHQDIQALHRVRERLIKERTALGNQIRGLLSEYGIILPIGIQNVRKNLPLILDNTENELTPISREFFAELYTELCSIEERIAKCHRHIERIFLSNPVCHKLAEVEGVGTLTATALIASVGDSRIFDNGRQMAAWLGLVPRQSSTGGKTVLLGITKRGNRYLRTLLIHGARAVLRYAPNKSDARSRWITSIKDRRGSNIAAVSLANKNARILWALMSRDEIYRKAV
jgi:transposase